MLPCNKA